jgi:hypothetical protein
MTGPSARSARARSPRPGPSGSGPVFPRTRYQGSKAKLAERIWAELAPLDFSTVLDAFGGTGAVGYRLRQEGKEVTYNDVLRFNFLFGRALIENAGVRLSPARIDALLAPPPRRARVGRFVQDTFAGIYYTDAENAWIDRTVFNLRHLTDRYERALGFFALAQACIVKRPYNLFHRKNLYLRFADVPRTFGNKASWDRPFDVWFRAFAEEANRAVFDNGRANRARCTDALALEGRWDLVYLDPPYLGRRGAPVDYRGFYHFLEGLAAYDRWPALVDRASRHRRLLPLPRDPWADRARVHEAFDRLFRRHRRSILAVSYRRDGIPSEQELVALLRRYKRDVRVVHFGRYRYALSTAAASAEMLLIAR